MSRLGEGRSMRRNRSAVIDKNENGHPVSENWGREEELPVSMIEEEEEEGAREEKEALEARPAEKNLFKVFLEAVGRYRLLTREEELRLLRKIQEGRRRIRAALRKLPKGIKAEAPARRRGAFLETTLIREREERLAQWVKAHPVPGLSDQERRMILNEIRVGEAMIRRAMERLIQANLRLVISIASRYKGMGLSMLDLIQEGNLGLIRAIEHFDPQKGYRFSTYATSWIRQAITRSLSDKARLVRLPIHMTERYYRLLRMVNALTQEKGREPTTEEIAKRAALKPSTVESLLQMTQDVLSLHAPVGEEGTELADFIADRLGLSPLDHTEAKEAREEIERALHSLTPREEKVLRMRFGIGEARDYSLEEIGRQLSVTRERVRQIERDALRKLRLGKVRNRLKTLVA